jgi:hypothetical protein
VPLAAPLPLAPPLLLVPLVPLPLRAMLLPPLMLEPLLPVPLAPLPLRAMLLPLMLEPLLELREAEALEPERFLWFMAMLPFELVPLRLALLPELEPDIELPLLPLALVPLDDDEPPDWAIAGVASASTAAASSNCFMEAFL